jgi:hypothetical protein
MCGSLYRFTERDLFFMAIYSNYSDQELSGLLKSGDQVVFTAIYNRYWKKMQGLPGAIPKIQRYRSKNLTIRSEHKLPNTELYYRIKFRIQINFISIIGMRRINIAVII